MLEMQSGFSTMVVYAVFFLYLLGLQLGCSLLVWYLLRDLQLDSDISFGLSFAGGMLLCSTISLALAWFKIQPSINSGLVWMGIEIALVGLLGFKYRRELWIGFSWRLLVLPLFFLVLLGARLAFINNLLVPSYSDSVEHVLIVQDLLQPDRHPQAYYRLARVPHPYYHFGFHALAAWLAGSTTTTAAQSVLLLGQYFQALAIFAIYPLARKIIKNSHGAWVLMLVGALIWPMPAFASNWGKYPAIASLTGLGFCLGLFAWMISTPKFGSRKSQAVLVFGVLATILLHSRQLLLLAGSGLVFWVLFDLKPNPFQSKAQKWVWGLSASIAAGMLLLAVQTLYGDQALIFNLVLLLLTLGALISDFRLTLGLIALVVLSVLLGAIPVKILLLNLRFDELIDHQFVEIVLFLPAAVLIWLGLEAGLRVIFKEKIRIGTGLLIAVTVGIALVNIVYYHSLRPSTCCVFVDRDDVFVMQTIKASLRPESVIAIAAVGKTKNYTAVDGGAWLESFTGMQARKIAFDTDFQSEKNRLCDSGIRYVYVDGLQNSFDEPSLQQAGGKKLFDSNAVGLYSLECPLAKQ